MDQIDHVANRVAISAVAGLFFGASLATYKGIPLAKTSLSAAASCALSGTACFTAERLAYNASKFVSPKEELLLLLLSKNEEKANDKIKKEEARLVFSHGAGGVLGGSICGGLFLSKPFKGILLFTPMMLAVTFLEIKLQRLRAMRVKTILEGESEG